MFVGFAKHYCLKQDPRAWYYELQAYLLSIGFINSQSDHSLYTLSHHNVKMYLLVYIDDLIVTGNNSSIVNRFIKHHEDRFFI